MDIYLPSLSLIENVVPQVSCCAVALEVDRHTTFTQGSTTCLAMPTRPTASGVIALRDFPLSRLEHLVGG